MTDGPPVIAARGLAVSIDGRWILRDVDLSVGVGEFVAIVGPNGAGKSTMLRALAGIVPSWGELQIGGVAITDLDGRTRARAVSYLPQGATFHWPVPVQEVVALGRIPHGFAAGGSLSAADREAVAQAITATELAPLATRRVTELSVGERARVALARVLAVAAPVILTDEPTAGLDARFQLVILDILRAQADAGVAVIAVLDDLTLAARFADRVLVVAGGKVVADGVPAAILNQRLLSGVFGVEAAVVEENGDRTVVPWRVTRRAGEG
ncbi:MAG: ABC transporter ATP-binding protein [Bauldia sp.]|nr:ABC transporter ATP-binding protein [Bauldia sp.]